MPSYVQALPFLLAAFAMPSSTTATTNTTIVGNTTLRPRVRNIKHSKKQGSIPNMAETCTMERFLGKSHYINCRGEDTEVVIACDTTETLCSYSEQPYPATSPAGCGDHGSFAPKTHLIRDPVTGGCRLKFFSLIIDYACDVAPAVVGGGFGVMVEVPQTTGEDKNPNDNSGLLLRFSRDGGVTYYNDGDLRETIPLNESSPQRTLAHTEHHREVDSSRCIAPNYCNKAISYHYLKGNIRKYQTPTTFFFQNCWRFELDNGNYQYCWSNAHQKDNIGDWHPCHPDGADWEPIAYDHGPPSCSYACQDFHPDDPT